MRSSSNSWAGALVVGALLVVIVLQQLQLQGQSLLAPKRLALGGRDCTDLEAEVDALRSLHAEGEPRESLRKLQAEVESLRRKLMLKEIRSFRTSGTIMNHGLISFDEKARAEIKATGKFRMEAPHEGTFDFYPPQFRRMACMGNLVKYPPACKLQAPASVSCAERPCTVRSIAPPYAPDQFSEGVFTGGDMFMLEDATPVWSRKLVDVHLAMADVSPKAYPGAQEDVVESFRFIGGLEGKTVGIFGSISPWLEALTLNASAAEITTVDYNLPVCLSSPHDGYKRRAGGHEDDGVCHPRMKTRSMEEVMLSLEQFDVSLSFSSIEHDGLGRYGDPLDPDGDLAAMRELWLKTRPGGYLLLAVPVKCDDQYFWYSMRYYGLHRIRLLLRGWEVVALVDKGVQGASQGYSCKELKHDQPVWVLRKAVGGPYELKRQRELADSLVCGDEISLQHNASGAPLPWGECVFASTNRSV